MTAARHFRDVPRESTNTSRASTSLQVGRPFSRMIFTRARLFSRFQWFCASSGWHCLSAWTILDRSPVDRSMVWSQSEVKPTQCRRSLGSRMGRGKLWQIAGRQRSLRLFSWMKMSSASKVVPSPKKGVYHIAQTFCWIWKGSCTIFPPRPGTLRRCTTSSTALVVASALRTTSSRRTCDAPRAGMKHCTLSRSSCRRRSARRWL
mmetsp:Transcript_35127/g.110578  ORF Transcript_35127/g.110578 Transcript_35127/m.110578 type:complete len:205 (+) Transcript_35127:1930-2544(+)